jgi:hypothetical protein
MSLAGEIIQLHTEGLSRARIAKKLKITESTVRKHIKKNEGLYSPVDDLIKKVSSKGIKYSDLKSKLDFKNKQEALEALEENFPNCIIYSNPLEDGDIEYLPIADSGSELSNLNIDISKKKFKFYVSPDKNYMFVQFNKSISGKDIKIYNLTDVHVGSKHHRLDLLKEHVRIIESDPNAFAFFGGDMFEFNHRDSVGDPSEQYLNPNEQVFESASIFSPIAHKILAYVGGNHDKGRGRRLGVDMAEMLSGLLKIPYFKVETVIDIEFKNNLFTAILDHGRGSGRTINSILADAQRYRQYSTYFVNWHLSGHVHRSFVLPEDMICKEVGSGLSFKRTYTVVGGSYMARTGTYAEESKFAPAAQDLTYIQMSEDGRYTAGSVEIITK